MRRSCAASDPGPGEGASPGSRWNTSLTATPRATRLARAASMSDTTRKRPRAEPGAAEVIPLPKWTEHAEPGGVNCNPRNASPLMNSASSRQPSLRVEALGAIDIRDGNDDDFELHVERRGGGRSVLMDRSVDLVHDNLLPSPVDDCAAGDHFVTVTTSGIPFSTMYVASSAAVPLPTLVTRWTVPAGMSNTSPALRVTGSRPSSAYSNTPSMT